MDTFSREIVQNAKPRKADNIDALVYLQKFYKTNRDSDLIVAEKLQNVPITGANGRADPEYEVVFLMRFLGNVVTLGPTFDLRSVENLRKLRQEISQIKRSNHAL